MGVGDQGAGSVAAPQGDGPGGRGDVALPRRSLLEVIDHFAMDGTAPDLARLREEIGEALAREYLEQQDRG